MRSMLLDFYNALHNAWPALSKELRELQQLNEDAQRDHEFSMALVREKLQKRDVTCVQEGIEELAKQRDEHKSRVSEMEDEREEWEKDCAKELRALADENDFEWEDGEATADQLAEHVRLTIEELEDANERLTTELELARLALAKREPEPQTYTIGGSSE